MSEQVEKRTNKERLKEITDSIEYGIQELFESEKYATYLRTMSRFHRYSLNNQMLIYMQRPDATLVAGYDKWKNQFERNVKKGEHGIKIIAPTPYKKKIEEQKLDPDTHLPLLDKDGQVIIEEREIKIPMFKPVTVFDVAQTDGKPLPELASDLSGEVKDYSIFVEAIRRASPVPIEFRPIADNADGYFSLDKQSIVIRECMSEVQTISALIHEIAHAKLHNTKEPIPPDAKKYQEVELFNEPSLFSNGRIKDADIPDGLFRYDLRGSDDDPGLPVTVEQNVVVNHAGSILIATPLCIPECGFIKLSEDEGLNFVGGEITAYEFRNNQKKDRRTEEVEAESISYAVCAYYGIATGENSFGYIATWSKDKELSELRKSLETISATASGLIDEIGEHIKVLLKERESQEVSAQEPEKSLSEMNVLEMVDHFMEQGMTEEQANEIANSEWQARKQTEQPRTEEGLYLLDDTQFLHVQFSEAGTWDFTFYDKQKNELKDGGFLDHPEYSIEEARDIILAESGIYPKSVDSIEGDAMISTLEIIQASVLEETERAVAKIRAMEAQSDLCPYPPDPSMTLSVMHDYGYLHDGMLPLSKTRAKELFEQDATIYTLYEDNTEAMVFDAADITGSTGLWGIETDEWQRIKGRVPCMDADTVRKMREFVFLGNEHDSFAIYQLKRTDATTDLRFMNFDWLERKGLVPNMDNYDLVYADTLHQTGSQIERLESLYETFNVRHPEDFMGHSLSVSDIVALKQNGVVSCHYVDSIGFRELPNFFRSDNYLRITEMQVEDDYNMIDGIINNGTKEEVKVKKPSVLEALNSKKPEKGKEKAKHNRAEMER